MKILLMTVFAAFVVGSVVGCCDDKGQTACTQHSSASMQTDSKDMQNHH